MIPELTDQSGWIELGLPYRDYVGNNDAVSRGIIRAGVQIRFEDGDELLIGDINQKGGRCDCCMVCGEDAIITHYRVVFTP